MHTCSHLIHTVQFVCVHCSSLPHKHARTHAHTYIHTSVYLAALFSLSSWKENSNPPPVCPEGWRLGPLFALWNKERGATQTLSSPLICACIRSPEANRFCRRLSPPPFRPQSSCHWQSPCERWRPVWKRECVAECCWARRCRWRFGWRERRCETRGWTARRFGAAGLRRGCGPCRSESRSLTSGWCWRHRSGPERQTGTASCVSGWVWPDTAGGWVQSAQSHTPLELMMGERGFSVQPKASHFINISTHCCLFSATHTRSCCEKN